VAGSCSRGDRESGGEPVQANATAGWPIRKTIEMLSVVSPEPSERFHKSFKNVVSVLGSTRVSTIEGSDVPVDWAGCAPNLLE